MRLGKWFQGGFKAYGQEVRFTNICGVQEAGENEEGHDAYVWFGRWERYSVVNDAGCSIAGSSRVWTGSTSTKKARSRHLILPREPQKGDMVMEEPCWVFSKPPEFLLHLYSRTVVRLGEDD